MSLVVVRWPSTVSARAACSIEIALGMLSSLIVRMCVGTDTTRNRPEVCVSSLSYVAFAIAFTECIAAAEREAAQRVPIQLV